VLPTSDSAQPVVHDGRAVFERKALSHISLARAAQTLRDACLVEISTTAFDSLLLVAHARLFTPGLSTSQLLIKGKHLLSTASHAGAVKE